jgi:hypothetical protein
MGRKAQQYSNHRQVVPLYHLLTFVAMAALLTGTLYYLFSSEENPLLLRALLVLMVLTIISVSFHCRSFALRAQDRAIRAEENFRHYILTGKPLDRSLSIYQVIALRFASDEEFVALSKKALQENLKPYEIKRLVKDWRPDHHRA